MKNRSCLTCKFGSRESGAEGDKACKECRLFNNWKPRKLNGPIRFPETIQTVLDGIQGHVVNIPTTTHDR